LDACKSYIKKNNNIRLDLKSMPDMLKIIHLEDLKTDAELVKRELLKGNLNFDTCLVDNKEDFKKALKEFSPDVILSDHSLPSFNSFEALEIFKESGLKIPFILITATVSEEFAVDVMKKGASDYILKDRLQRLPNAINNAIEKCKIELEREKYYDKIVADEAVMKKAQHLARFGTWNINLLNDEHKWSDETFNILGFKPGEVEPSFKNFLQNIHPEDKINVKKIIEETINKIDSVKLNFRIANKDGSVRYVMSEIFVVGNENKPQHIIGFNRDVTETMLVEESLKKSEANLRTIFENTDTAYLLIDPEFKVISFNQLANDWAYFSQNIILKEGTDLLSLLPHERRETFSDMLHNVLEGKYFEYEINYPAKNGKLIWYFVRLNNIRKEDEHNMGICITVSDITERKNIEVERNRMISEIIQQNKNLEQFAYIVSHNLRAPVANIIGLSDILHHFEIEEGSREEVIRGLNVSAKNLDKIILDLNNILQIKHINEDKALVDFSELLNEVKTSIKNLIKKDHVIIKSDFSEKESIMTIKSYLHSIFYNLIVNSIKYKKSDIQPVIEIKSRLNNGSVELLFKDNGLGFNLESKQDQIFGLYKRFHNHIEGKGMGLFMTKMQVETLGGKITVNSEENKGTEFKIQFSN
jgi:PAS domain S-box-containing protein